ncbi:hypothetical protein C8F04DRAFT_1177509 [Mycena alexandri]|uniref:Uncharacterized protein n=1 Tax=Mycena alexandri TaxID=1745969 RepID=A0AAD6T7J4_9AGAR|nr:hypothetical protein C8F04DRAFT_1177509 [Mycena alexandri]
MRNSAKSSGAGQTLNLMASFLYFLTLHLGYCTPGRALPSLQMNADGGTTLPEVHTDTLGTDTIRRLIRDLVTANLPASLTVPITFAVGERDVDLENGLVREAGKSNFWEQMSQMVDLGSPATRDPSTSATAAGDKPATGAVGSSSAATASPDVLEDELASDGSGLLDNDVLGSQPASTASSSKSAHALDFSPAGVKGTVVPSISRVSTSPKVESGKRSNFTSLFPLSLEA